MREIQLLDCTLRDGGYLNDWEFGNDTLLSLYGRLTDAGVDIVEVGFLDDRRPYDFNRSIFPDTDSIRKIWGNYPKKPAMVVGMIDYGTCSIDNIEPCSESFLDGIRVIFKKHLAEDALDFCKQLKDKGYLVFAQLVSITSYDDDELLKVIDKANKVEPYAVSIVDTYGLLTPDRLIHYYSVLDDNLEPEIRIGFHAHNNLQLAFANDMAFVERETSRNILVDATLYGMGKSAGNAPLELVSRYLNENHGGHYSMSPILEAITESILPLFDKKPWGYQMIYYMSASNKCHPNYVSYMIQKENLSTSNIDVLLGNIKDKDEKLLYSRDIADGIYGEYNDKETEQDNINYENLKEELRDKSILLIGPGKNLKLQNNKVEEYIDKNNPTIISINFLPKDIKVSYAFISKKQRYQRIIGKIMLSEKSIRTIATSNVTATGDGFDYVFDREKLLEEGEQINDNSFVMLLTILQQIGVREIACAGLDGYSERESNYENPSMEYSFIKGSANYLNKHVKELLKDRFKDIHIKFVTYSHYTNDDESYDIVY